MEGARSIPSPWHDAGYPGDRERRRESPAPPRRALGAWRRVAVVASGRGARNPTARPPTRISSLAVALTVAVTMAASILAPLAVRAHGGHPVGRALTVIQAVGPTEVAVTIEPPSRAPGPLFVLIRPAIAPDAATLTLAAVPRGAASGPAPVPVRLAAASAGPYTAELGDIDNGDWELLLRADGPAGSGEARIPFAVAPPRRSLAGTVREVAVGTLGVVLIAAVVAVGAAARRRRELPRWLPGALGHGVVACLAVAALTGVSEVLRPPADRLTATTASRPHVNLLLRTEPARPEAGRPVALALDLFDGATGRPVDDLVPHHEALVHAVVVGADGGFFAHLHPARIGPGRFRVALTPDQPGSYALSAEVSRRDGGSQVVSRPFVVGGDGAGPPAATRSPMGRHAVDDLVVDGSGLATPPRPGEPVTLTFRVEKNGHPVPALEAWLGMPGHLIVRRTDDAIFAHVHAAGAMAPIAPGEGAARVGPEVRFTYAFPAAGSYQLWLQFQVDGRVRTLPFRVEVGGEKAADG